MRCCVGVGGSTAYSVSTGVAANVTPVSLTASGATFVMRSMAAAGLRRMDDTIPTRALPCTPILRLSSIGIN